MAFRKQPIFCPMCGLHFEGDPTNPEGHDVACIREKHWRRALYSMGVEYYPRPDTEKVGAE